MKIDRLLGIVITLLQRDTVTAPYLAEKFEVSRRTINRDIDTLCLAGIPIVSKRGSGGGLYIEAGYKFDKSVLTADEQSMIVSAIKAIGTVSPASRIHSTLDKFTANTGEPAAENDSVIIDLASFYRSSLTEKIELIKQTIKDCHAIEFDYYYEKGEDHRVIEPYFVTFQWGEWYVFGYCLLKCDWRMFKLNRLWSARVLDEVFERREIPAERMDFNARFYKGEPVAAIFDSSMKYALIESYGPDCFSQAEDGSLYFKIDVVTDMSYIKSWFLGFGEKVRVLEPQSLADDIKLTAEKILESYLNAT